MGDNIRTKRGNQRRTSDNNKKLKLQKKRPGYAVGAAGYH